MLSFDCPFCKTNVPAADELGGKTVLCPTCKQAVAVPRSNAITDIAPPLLPPLTAVTTPDVAAAAQHEKAAWKRDDDEMIAGQENGLSIRKDGGASGVWK